MDETTTDPLPGLVADIDQYLASAKLLAPVIAADFHALRSEGLSSLEAAVLAGTRWKAT